MEVEKYIPSQRALQQPFCLYPFKDSICQRRTAPANNEITNNTRNIKNKILAIPAAPAAMPPNPKRAAIRAIIKNITVHLSIIEILVGSVTYIENIEPMKYFKCNHLICKALRI